MKILDLRPWYERPLHRWWRGRSLSARSGLWSRFWGRFPALRAARRRSPPGRPFIVSVGNLALGGSGKTPVVGRLAQDLASAGMKVAILTRGYGSGQRSPLLVAPDCQGCGDEARLLASQLAAHGIVLVQAVQRGKGFEHLVRRFPDLDCVLLDDGYQTGGLGRDLDILILNAWAADSQGVCVPLAGPVFPVGPWREPAAAAMRADVWLLETAGGIPAGVGYGPLVTAFHRVSRLVGSGGQEADTATISGWAAVSGIARPENFEAAAAGIIGRGPLLAVRCRDHDPYDTGTLRTVDEAMVREGLDTLVITAKDWVKLAGRIPAGRRVFILEQEVRWAGKQTLPGLVRERMRGQVEERGI